MNKFKHFVERYKAILAIEKRRNHQVNRFDIYKNVVILVAIYVAIFVFTGIVLKINNNINYIMYNTIVTLIVSFGLYKWILESRIREEIKEDYKIFDAIFLEVSVFTAIVFGSQTVIAIFFMTQYLLVFELIVLAVIYIVTYRIVVMFEKQVFPQSNNCRVTITSYGFWTVVLQVSVMSIIGFSSVILVYLLSAVIVLLLVVINAHYSIISSNSNTEYHRFGLWLLGIGLFSFFFIYILRFDSDDYVNLDLLQTHYGEAETLYAPSSEYSQNLDILLAEKELLVLSDYEYNYIFNYDLQLLKTLPSKLEGYTKLYITDDFLIHVSFLSDEYTHMILYDYSFDIIDEFYTEYVDPRNSVLINMNDEILLVRSYWDSSNFKTVLHGYNFTTSTYVSDFVTLNGYYDVNTAIYMTDLQELHLIRNPYTPYVNYYDGVLISGHKDSSTESYVKLVDLNSMSKSFTIKERKNPIIRDGFNYQVNFQGISFRDNVVTYSNYDSTLSLYNWDGVKLHSGKLDLDESYDLITINDDKAVFYSSVERKVIKIDLSNPTVVINNGNTEYYTFSIICIIAGYFFTKHQYKNIFVGGAK